MSIAIASPSSFSHKHKRPVLAMSVPGVRKSDPQPHREVKPWDDRDKVIAIVESFRGKYGSRISELRPWQRKLLVHPVPVDANRQVRESYYKAVKCAVEQFNGLRPPPEKAIQRSRFTPPAPIVASNAPSLASVPPERSAAMYTVYGGGLKTPSSGNATVRDIRSAPKKVNNNGYGKARRELTPEEQATADAQSAAAMAKKAAMFERKITAPAVKTDKNAKKGGNKSSNKK